MDMSLDSGGSDAVTLITFLGTFILHSVAELSLPPHLVELTISTIDIDHRGTGQLRSK